MLIVLVSLALCVLTVAVLLGLMFADVAFHAPEVAGAPLAGARSWRPPLLRGRRLREWASQVAEVNTTRRLSDRRDAAAALELADELHAGTSLAIEQPWQKYQPAAAGCPGHEHSMTAITAPEAILAASYLRRFHPDQVQHIRDQAVENVRRTAGMDHVQYRSAAVRCPLLGSDNVCLAFGVRPLRCRAGCDLSADGTSGCAIQGSAVGLAGAESCEFESRGELVAAGAERGFSRALESAGLDGQLYELNGALVAALDAPQAARSWIQGEPVFENCRKYQ